jgi:hypothetical protein
MKTLISILLLLSFTTNSSLKKRILPYGIVISKADLIVDGKISKVSSNEYELEIDDFVKGQSSTSIKVKIWKEWTCDSRIEKAQIGQRLILFLTQSENGKYEIINGSTGELIVGKDDSVKTFMKSEFPNAALTKNGIKQFLKAYEYKGSLYPKYNEEKYFKRLIEQSEIDKMMAENEFFKSTVLSLKYYEIK